MWKDFKEFISRGNVIDLAVAVVMGAAFTAIVNSIVSDLLMPLISLITGGVDFSAMKFVIGSGEDAAAFTYGNLINAVLQFLIISVVIFLIIRAINRASERAKALASRKHKGGEEEEAPAAPTCPYCLEEIKEGATRCPHCAGDIAGFPKAE